MDKTDHTTEYARAVYKGDIIASEKNRQAAERHLKDLKRKDFKYHFDVDRANKIIKFIEMLPDPKTGKLLKLASFQKFIVGSKYGWVNEFGDRRFTKSYVSMARKNGKTILISGEAIAEMLLGKEPANERLVGLSANSREQAGIAFDMAQAQLEAARAASDRIKNMTKVTASKKEIENLEDRSKIKAVSNEASNLEGYQFSYAVIDEYHEAKDTKMYEALRRGQVLLRNPGLHIISTAGFNTVSPMYDEYEYVAKILDGRSTNENYFAFVAEQDSEDEIYDESVWIKSNPLMEIPEVGEILKKNIREDLDEAIEKNDLNAMIVKNFNMWRQASEDSYISLNDWRLCQTDEEFDPRGRQVYIGVDLSRRDDLTAIGLVYPLEKGKSFVDAHVFVGHKGGIRRKSERDKIDYEKLIETDRATLTNTASGVISEQQVFEWIVKFIEGHNLDVKGIMYDPWNAANLIVAFEGHDYPLIEVKQNYMNLSGPLKQFKLDVFERNIIHDGNPNLSISINNAIEKVDNNGNVLLDKKKNREKIDALIGVINAYSRSMHHEEGNSLEDYIFSEDFGF